MKSIFSLIISTALVVSCYSQTRNVLVGTNNTVVQPTNFWSADASNARTGLGLGSAATNPTSAFQPSSTVLSNLASSNGVNLTNIAVSNVVGTLSLGQGGTGSTNAAAARTALGLETAATNPASAFQPSSSVLTNLAASNGGSLTNITASNITGTIAISNGGSGSTTAGGARTNLGLGLTALTNTNSGLFNTAVGLGVSNTVYFAEVGVGRALDAYTMGGTAAITNQNFGFSFKQSGISFLTISNLTGTNGGALIFHGTVGAATTRTNLGLGATWLANTNVTNFRTDIGIGWSALTNTNTSGFNSSLYGSGTNPVLVSTNGEVVSPTNFWQVAPINTRVQLSQPVVNATNAATNARNLYLYSLAISTTGVTNTITLPTNSLVFLGDVATVIHDGPTSSVTAIRQIGSATNLITLNQVREAVKFIYESGGWRLADNISYVEPIYFSGTNAAENAAISRTNLGIPSSFGTTTLSAIGGGQSNVAQRNYGVVGGGLQNVNIGFSSVIGGGSVNTILEGTITLGSVIGGGNSNTINGSSYSVIGGGRFNTNGGTADFGSFIGGGYFNTIDGSYSVVGGGAYNTAASNYSTVIGGLSNSATALYSLAAGLRAKATNDGSFVWADNQNSDFSSTNINSFNVRASGGMSLDLGTNGIIFRTNASAAVTRTNLGLGETNNVTFSALTLSSDLTLGSGDNIVLSTTNGTKIGTATNQLLGFYNQTPITQPSSTGVTTSGFTGGSGATVHPQSTFTGGIGTNAYTISDIVAHLKSLGLIAP